MTAQPSSSKNRLLNAALFYATQMGWRVFPCHSIRYGRCTCGKRAECSSPGKHPRWATDLAHGCNSGTSDADIIRKWWRRWPDAHIGLATGAGSGVWVLDVDPRHGGDLALFQLEQEHGRLPDTLQSVTGSKGSHRFFRHPGGKVNNEIALAPGLDIRGDGGLVILPPSGHVSGNTYEWDGLDGIKVPIADAPQWLLDLVCEVPQTRKVSRQIPAVIPDGTKHRTCVSLAGSMRRRGCNSEEIFAALSKLSERFATPVPMENLKKIAEDIEGRYSPEEAGDGPSDEKAAADSSNATETESAGRSDVTPGNAGVDQAVDPDPGVAGEPAPARLAPGQDVAGGDTEEGDVHRDASEPDTGGSRSGVPSSLTFLVAKLRAGGDARLVYDSVETIARLSAAELAVVYQFLKEILGKKLNITDLRKAVDEAQSRRRAIEAEAKERQPAPHPYRIQSGGIVRLKQLKVGVETIPLTNFTARVTANVIEDDGVEVRRHFAIEVQLDGTLHALTVPASEFNSLDWVVENVGPSAIIHPNQKEYARAAIQTFSPKVQERQIYVHTGWRKINNSMLYLHAGGAIGAAGAVPGVEVQLQEKLSHYLLPLPGSEQDLVRALRASLYLLRVAPPHITFVILAAVYRAAIRSCDFVIWLVGHTGVFKTEVAALAQQHFGAAMHARQLPASFSSTGNALEVLAFCAQEVLLVVDDFAPHGGTQDIARYHATADRLVRAAGNQQGRGRLTADARMREGMPPRGLILATGEDVPRGQSIRARTLIVDVAPDDVRITTLTRCQAFAAAGAYATAMGGFVQWLAGDYDALQERFQKRVVELRSEVSNLHARTPGIVAELRAAFDLFLEFAVTRKAISPARRDLLTERCRTALIRLAASQGSRQEDSEPAHRFLELLRAAILSGAAYVEDIAGGPPADAGNWGWQLVAVRDDQVPRDDQRRYSPRGKCVGWLAGSRVYLEPTSSFAAAQDMGRATGEPLVVSPTTLHKRLHENGKLASIDATRGTLTVRRKIRGASISVLELQRDVLSPAASSTTSDKPEPSPECQSEEFEF